ncbi:MAG: SDR family NAD(P)-dependent oxidoreductase [Polyangiales bacterium]
MAQSFHGKKVIITGGSSGIGKAIAAALVRQGAHVCIAARRPDALEEAVAELSALATHAEQRVCHQVLDVSDRAAVQQAAPQMLAALGGLDVLINNAGIAHVGYLEQESAEAYERMIAVNYLGAVWMTQAFLPHFMQQKSGTLAYVSSLLGLMGLFGYSAYCGSKHALTGYADALRQDLLRYNIQVSVLFPADTDTPQLHEENKSKPPETAAVAGTLKPASAESVAQDFLAGLSRGRYHIIPGLESRATMWAVRHLPAVARWVIDRDLRKAAQARG